MADLQSQEGSSSRDASGESSESTLQLNIKTLDCRIFSFHVDKNILVSSFKDKIAGETGIPVGQQRLIFRGKVLKDEHVISNYNVENGDTLHVVQRQQPQPPPSFSTGEETSRQDFAAGGSRNRLGQMSHSVVLGPLNAGDAGEAFIPDLSRVIGAVLNSVGFGNLPGGMQPGILTSQANETGGPQVNGGSQNHGGNPLDSSQGIPGQSAFYPMQTPIGAAVDVPLLNMPIPDSLNTLTEFMNQMEMLLLQHGGQQDQPPTSSRNPPTPDLPRNSRGYLTVDALTVVLQHSQQFLRDRVVPALSHVADRLNQDRDSNDPLVREQVHTESMQFGVAVQHLGSLLLELGRTILTLHLGQSPDDSYVNAGPAVYISPSGPNPIMVQPFPLQSSSLFGGSSGVAPNPAAMGGIGIGSAPRNVHIHIHTGASLAPIISTMANREFNGEDMRGARANGIDSAGGVSQASDTSSLISEIASLFRRTPINRQNEDRAPPESSANQEQPVGSSARENDESSRQRNMFSSRGQSEPSTSSQGGPHNGSSNAENIGGSSGVPLGLGLGGLQPKRRGKQPQGQDKNSGDASSNNQDTSMSVGQQVLQSLASHPKRENPNPPSSTARQNADSQTDVVDAMSQVLGIPSLDGLLAGVAQQTGVGSPDMLRNMLQQFTQDPAMRNTVNQIAQQMDGHDLASMFSGQGGGMDLSSMMQQMMPIVSQALGSVSSTSQLNPPSGSVRSGSSSTRVNDIDLRPVVQRLEDEGPSEEIFRSLVARAARLSSGGSEEERVLNELCSLGGLAQEFMEMLRLDVSRILHDQMRS